jgi:tRNA threonylcarbamoyladenosine biosynthesis protein TsaE
MLLPSEEATLEVGRTLAALLRPRDVVALSGDLGAGKTTLTRGVLRGLGFEGDVASPTFPLVIPYEQLSPPLWHIDLYRIESSDELEQLALDEAREGAALVIEWPERMGASLWTDSLRLHLALAQAGARSLTAKVPPAWKGRWSLP